MHRPALARHRRGPGALRVARRHRVGERAPLARRQRVDRHARGLVHHQQPRALHQHAERRARLRRGRPAGSSTSSSTQAPGTAGSEARARRPRTRTSPSAKARLTGGAPEAERVGQGAIEPAGGVGREVDGAFHGLRACSAPTPPREIDCSPSRTQERRAWPSRSPSPPTRRPSGPCTRATRSSCPGRSSPPASPPTGCWSACERGPGRGASGGRASSGPTGCWSACERRPRRMSLGRNERREAGSARRGARRSQNRSRLPPAPPARLGARRRPVPLRPGRGPRRRDRRVAVRGGRPLGLAARGALDGRGHRAVRDPRDHRAGGDGPTTGAALARCGAVYLHATGALAVTLAHHVMRVASVHLLDELGLVEAIGAWRSIASRPRSRWTRTG